jgi:glycosyltransferase involved in cell wall biosynthesis
MKTPEHGGNSINIVHLGVGAIPVPPVDKAAGTERYLFHLTDNLGRLGSNVSVIDIKGGLPQKDRRRQSSATYYEVRHPPLPGASNSPILARFFDYLLLMLHLLFFSLPAVFTLNKLYRRQKPDIIHLHSSLPAMLSVLLNKIRRKRAVTVYTLHTGFGTSGLSWKRKLPALPEILAMKWVNHIVAPSPAVKKWLVSELKLPPEKITQIYTSADISEAGDYLSRKKIPTHQSKIVLGVGSISPRKNQFSAVKAVPLVAVKHPDVKFVFAGLVAEAGYYNVIKEYIKENNLSSWVEFTGEISREELYRLYSEAAIFLFPTTAEAQGLVMAEAMAFGLPVIASNIEPIQDMVSHEENSAILIDPYDVEGIADAINRLFEDNTLRQSVTSKGEKLARLFSHEYIATEMLGLYGRLLENGRRTGIQTSKK